MSTDAYDTLDAVEMDILRHPGLHDPAILRGLVVKGAKMQSEAGPEAIICLQVTATDADTTSTRDYMVIDEPSAVLEWMDDFIQTMTAARDDLRKHVEGRGAE